ncbi:MAG: HAD family hydrolase [Planctomycetaceae bacterium]|jgi:phosphoglycolate phosphatase|nr:HAD family hydrolase [Planctomycetaceae bacterium]
MLENITYSRLLLSRCVIFDLDGTLCDTIGDIERSLVATFERCDFPVPNMSRLRVGPPLSDMIRNLVGQDIDKSFIDNLAASYREDYESSDYGVSPLYSGAFELLVRLKSAGKKLGIATLKREASTMRLVDCKEIRAFFDTIFCCDSRSRLYTKDQMLATIIDELDILPSDAIFLGDSANDIEAGQKNGIPTVAVLFGYGDPEDLIAAKPNYICENYTELI